MVPFVGEAYQLENRKFDVQDSVNLYPVISEASTSKAPFILQSIPGLTEFAELASVRQMFTTTGGRCFAVAGPSLYELDSEGETTVRGTLLTSTGPVDMDANLNQLVIVDGDNGYVLQLSSNSFSRIGSDAFYGSTRVAILDGYAIFIRPDTGQFYITSIDEASELDALDFATAEGSPDNLTSVVADHRELWLFGTHTTEVWFNSGAADFPFERNQGAFLEVGCAAAHSARKIDNSVIWLGQDRNGSGMVYRADGFTPRRVSKGAVEKAIQESTDLSSAAAYTYQQDGHSFYCLNVPGSEATWVYDLKTDAWHRRVELVDGAYEQHRATCHTYAFGKNLVGGAGGVYELDSEAHTNAGDVLCRERTSPHYAVPSLEPQFFASFELDTTAGETLSGSPMVSMRYSNDGGRTWGSWMQRSMGGVGEYAERVRWLRCGSGRDRVWQVRCTDDAPFSIIGAHIG